ncbi:uncharacterized protein LOC130420706 isoform X2 [Triplophysa dalaica]|uniref:uncharacterized protein LOC130420706 isoform X2 n=1 Tax=Triplophysa dalaica TaxID=1582913 RepID=UPI0024DF30D0|nr:uncharacterized protein LOC130420706 isoform X2 [Triplophysa dalaica]
METTFCLQRRQINVLPAPSITDLRDQWQYLFTQKGLYAHFELLTEVNILRALEMSMEECGRIIAEFFSNKPSNADVRAVLSRRSDIELFFFVIQLLMAHFSETQEGLILFANASSTPADVERTHALPATPRLILLASTTTSILIRVILVIVEVSVFAAPTVILLQIICAGRAQNRRRTQNAHPEDTVMSAVWE